MHAPHPSDADTLAAAAPDLIVQLRQVLAARRRLIALVTMAALVLGILHLRTTEYLYQAQLRVAAAPGSASRTPRLGSLSGLAALAGVGTEAEATPFRLYLEDLQSPLTAAALAADPALMRQVFADEWTGTGWAPKASFLDRAHSTLLALAGSPVPAATPPDADRLQDWLARNIIISEEQRSPVVTLYLDHSDPAFAKAMLERLHEVADARARARATARAEANVAHLDQRLADTAPFDLRQAIIATRAAEEQRLMLARNPTPFATQRFGGAVATSQPVSPKQGRVLLIALVLGLVGGALLAVLLGPLRKAQ